MPAHMTTCRACGGEGRELIGHANDPHPRDVGPCEFCDAGQVRVTTWSNYYAPREEAWSATWGDFDLGSPVATGATQEAAINDLLENY